ncbi:hypothetical protein SLEP1_g15468 [Rubroshorea leprosula]|uniref:Uncharacterized protein n=1 Tax=Rubroshorea leprosula TaxID=152421 RepID=A0AAV5IWA5_9ROSI|nr:hypothetical protein SLEP1_g15468 [Rubroshorea leprosula]
MFKAYGRDVTNGGDDHPPLNSFGMWVSLRRHLQSCWS